MSNKQVIGMVLLIWAVIIIIAISSRRIDESQMRIATIDKQAQTDKASAERFTITTSQFSPDKKNAVIVLVDHKTKREYALVSVAGISGMVPLQ